MSPRRWRVLVAQSSSWPRFSRTWRFRTLRAASLFARAAHVGGRVEQFAAEHARAVTVMPRHTIPTRSGDVPCAVVSSRRDAARGACSSFPAFTRWGSTSRG